MDYQKIIIALIEHFTYNEGTDYLGSKDQPRVLASLSPDEQAELVRLRDIARTNIGWDGY